MKYLYLFFIFIPCILQAQISDTLLTSDSLTASDTLLTPDTLKAESDIKAPINYSAKDSAVFDVKGKKLLLYNQAEVTYQDLKLNAGFIVLDQDAQTLEALGLPDTAREGEFLQTPLMFQGEDRYEGARLTYNFDSQQGNVSEGYTEAEIGYYFGEKIKKVSDEVYFVKNGLYTTSNNREDPEYYFLSPEMKVIPNDKVIANNVFLYIEGVPVFWLPFAVFPNKSGRSSGLIIPTFGEDGTYGFYLNGIGYFWAINDYLDVNATAGLFTRGKIDLRSRFRYALKYNLRGSVDAGFTRIRLGEDSDVDKFSSDEWALNVYHNQIFDPTLTLDGNLSFISGKSYYDNSTNDLENLLRQNVISSLTLSKFWEGTPFSANLNYYREQNLQTGDRRERLPSFTFVNSETFPFTNDYSTPGNEAIYEFLSYSYNLTFQNDKRKSTVTSSIGTDSTFKDSRLAARNFAQINFSPRFQFFNIRPYFNYTELWYNKSIVRLFNPIDSTVITSDVNKFNAVRYFNTGVDVSTKLIGIFTPRIFNITGIRHTITPTISYRYTPGYGDGSSPYYGTYRDENGNEIRYSLFEREAFGNAPSEEEQLINMNIGNIFEMKTRVNDSTENKFQLFNINANLGYNFARDTLRFDELRTDFRTQIGSLLNVAGFASFNLYKFENSAQTRINKFLLDTDGKLAELTGFNLNISSNFNFNLTNSIPRTDFIERDTVEHQTEIVKDTIETVNSSRVNFAFPLSGGFNYNYNENRSNPLNVTRSSNISGNIGFNPTPNWKFTFSMSYDFVNKQIAAPYFTAYRDLNSWELVFDWRPTGLYRAFKIEIRIKAPDLRDVKVTKQSSNRGVFSDF